MTEEVDREGLGQGAQALADPDFAMFMILRSEVGAGSVSGIILAFCRLLLELADGL